MALWEDHLHHGSPELSLVYPSFGGSLHFLPAGKQQHELHMGSVTGITYRTAFRWWQNGQIRGFQKPSGTIILRFP
ncbi:MAG TPA: hypothetical protein VFV38_22905 [Ktedonobacteraceae bacterium]|nr:hypothetical protein [Ktedonobacteraceae bacterium]